MEHNINRQRKYKSDKDAHFETDIKSHTASTCAFEVSSRGTLTNENIARLSLIHKYLKKHIKKAHSSKTLNHFPYHIIIILHIHSKEEPDLGPDIIYQPPLLGSKPQT